MELTFEYPALLVKQTSINKPLVLFAAPASEINQWAGIPQKKRFGEEESVGFQRDENRKRVESLKSFFQDEANIIQNPLLCAARTLNDATVRFEPREELGDYQLGRLHIRLPDVAAMSFQEILASVRQYLETRVPELRDRVPNGDVVTQLKERARRAGHIEVHASAEESEAVDEEQGAESAEEPGEAEDVTSVLFEESHILDFWEEVAARHEVSKLIDSPIMEGQFLGFDREALVAYILPVVLVDGQHRLRGALAAARARLATDDLRSEIERRIADGGEPSAVEEDLLRRESRRLPVSLLMAAEPAEQVFQFVVVNQKATPVGRALLGTIVSTTLSNEEMATVASRLKNAGIKLEESQAITYLARHPESPFCGLVERGLAGDQQDLLQWNVFASLIGIFRYLREGKLYGERNDYAQVWRLKYLDESDIVADFSSQGCDDRFAYWSKLDGPWREVFMRFWTKVRDFFGDTVDPEKPNYWGRTRTSNLFNKISLTILAADFFQFLVERKKPISSVNDIPTLVDDWLEGVHAGYFAKDWNLAGIKKDSTGIRKQWASLWSQYRKNPQMLPQSRLYRSPKGE